MEDARRILSRDEAFKIVFDELKKNRLFRGHYDARNGEEHYMYGISCVMEYIAVNISEACYIEFSDQFITNMINSEKEAEENDKRGKR